MITKKTYTDKIEITKIETFYTLSCRERISVIEDGKEISASFQRYVLDPDADVEFIKDATVKAQFQAVMTDEVKQNFQAFKEAQLNPE